LEKAYETHTSGDYESSRYFAQARETGQAMASGLGGSIAFLMNVNGNHWAAVVIDFESWIIFYGDSLHEKPSSEVLAVLNWWTYHHTGQQFTRRSLAITQQQDGFSCGLLSYNALAHHFLPSECPLMAATQVRNGRLKIMLEVIDRHLDQARETRLY
jgi:hypothetical protein